MRRLLLVLFAVSGVVLVPSAVSRAQQPGLVVRAGDGEDGYAINTFLPASFTVASGTTVRWEFPWFEPHTVTFGVPQTGAPEETPSGTDYLGSGFHTSQLIFGPGKHYDVRFPVAGVFDYYCITHAEMKGTITVVDGPGEPQASVTARGQLEFVSALSELKSIAADWAARPDEQNTLSDGSTEHVVIMAGATRYGDVQQYFPPQVTVREGDSVRWHSVVRTPHTTTFGPFPGGLPIVGNPAVDDVYRPAEVYEGTGYWNSGVIGVDWPLGLDFSMRFAKPGSYLYYCILHDTQGMVAEVVVLPREATTTTPTATATASPGKPTDGASATPQPPRTGSGGDGQHQDWRPGGAAGIAAMVLLAAIGLGGLAALFARRAD